MIKLCSSKIGILHIWNDEHIESTKTNCINLLTLIGKIYHKHICKQNKK